VHPSLPLTKHIRLNPHNKRLVIRVKGRGELYSIMTSFTGIIRT
jgi:hypothetical protein